MKNLGALIIADMYRTSQRASVARAQIRAQARIEIERIRADADCYCAGVAERIATDTNYTRRYEADADRAVGAMRMASEIVAARSLAEVGRIQGAVEMFKILAGQMREIRRALDVNGTPEECRDELNRELEQVRGLQHQLLAAVKHAAHPAAPGMLTQ